MHAQNPNDPDPVRPDLNVRDGDHIRILDKTVMELNDKGELKSVIVVGIVRGGEIIARKNFELDKMNYNAIATVHGSNWLNQEMRINIVRKHAESGRLIDTIALSLPIIELPASGP
jgi:hypothetical protein